MDALCNIYILIFLILFHGFLDFFFFWGENYTKFCGVRSTVANILNNKIKILNLSINQTDKKLHFSKTFFSENFYCTIYLIYFISQYVKMMLFYYFQILKKHVFFF